MVAAIRCGGSAAGADEDGSEAIFESRSAQLGSEPAGVEGASNIYAWDANAKTLHLVSQLNTQAETEEALPGGAFAGPYGSAEEATQACNSLKSAGLPTCFIQRN